MGDNYDETVENFIDSLHREIVISDDNLENVVISQGFIDNLYDEFYPLAGIGYKGEQRKEAVGVDKEKQRKDVVEAQTDVVMPQRDVVMDKGDCRAVVVATEKDVVVPLTPVVVAEWSVGGQMIQAVVEKDDTLIPAFTNLVLDAKTHQRRNKKPRTRIY